jgi:ABC-type bacteriocin/lantibiotic exporter with double-glycine peptidase domain
MRRTFRVPEAIQTSAIDCGPAALKALAEGHGISASYGRLREACQTGVDGTSIDQIEIAAVELGLHAEQVMVPIDHLLSPAASVLPALVITRQPNGFAHFVIVWRRHAGWVQVMDPGIGRRWIREGKFLGDVHSHTQSVPAADWFEWASSESFLRPLRARMKKNGGVDEPLIADALAGGHVVLARLDAATRMVQTFIDCGALQPGPAPCRLRANLTRSENPLPDQYWSAFPHAQKTDVVQMRGAVLVSVQGVTKRDAEPSSPELAAALHEKPPRPLRDIGKLACGRALQPAAIVATIAAAAAGTLTEAVLLPSLFEISRDLNIGGQRLSALMALLILSAIVLVLTYSSTVGALRLGRKLETAVRIRFLSKLPRLADRYFQSRPMSDMASRSHQIHLLRQLPLLAAGFLRAFFEMAFVTAGIAWLYPQETWLAVALSMACLGIPLAAQSALNERDLRVRSHAGALSQFYLDALRGLTAIRAHGAESAIRREQGRLLGSWARAGLAVQRFVVGVEGLQLGVAFGLAGWMVWRNLQPGTEPAGALLLVYWALSLPVLGQEAAAIAWQYPMQRNTALRVLEPLQAPEEPEAEDVPDAGRKPAGVSIVLENVTVRAAGQVILDNVSLSVPAGSHVAIVGASGAGKSSLAGVLLGWHRAAEGRVLVDDRLLDSSVLRSLRDETAWVDPQVHLWNRPLFDNLMYGSATAAAGRLDKVLENADLFPVIEKLPAGMQTPLGEGGSLLSGGEGQRVRIGRALGRSAARLVILDEPARGLESRQRRAFLDRARGHWPTATLLAITHDIRDTRDFDRVLVIAGGRIAEDAAPAELAANRRSLYRQLLDAEEMVRRGLWSSRNWRRLTFEQGRVIERQTKPEGQTHYVKPTHDYAASTR